LNTRAHNEIENVRRVYSITLKYVVQRRSFHISVISKAMG